MVEDDVPGRVAGSEVDVEREVADGDGIALVEMVVHGASGSEAGWNEIKDESAKQYDDAEDVDKGDRAYVLTSDTGGAAEVQVGSSSCRITLSGFEGGPAEYERLALALVDAVVAKAA